MAGIIEKLNAVGQNTNQFNESIKLSDLDKDVKYQVEKFKLIKTKFGNRIVATIIRDEEYQDVFLPMRFTKQFKPKDIDNLNKSKITLTYRGVDDSNPQYPIQLVEFN